MATDAQSNNINVRQSSGNSKKSKMANKGNNKPTVESVIVDTNAPENDYDEASDSEDDDHSFRHEDDSIDRTKIVANQFKSGLFFAGLICCVSFMIIIIILGGFSQCFLTTRRLVVYGNPFITEAQEKAEDKKREKKRKEKEAAAKALEERMGLNGPANSQSFMELRPENTGSGNDNQGFMEQLGENTGAGNNQVSMEIGEDTSSGNSQSFMELGENTGSGNSQVSMEFNEGI